jgi:hypothetical protein
MGVRGVHFALDVAQRRRLLATLEKLSPEAELEQESLGDVIAEFEEEWAEPWLCETDKAWDAIHRVLGDGTLDGPQPPTALSRAVLGGRSLSGDSGPYFVTPEQVVETAQAMARVSHEWFLERFTQVCGDGDYEGPGDEDDRGYSWGNFCELRDFFDRAAKAGRAVMFDA